MCSRSRNLLFFAALLALAGCQREKRDIRPSPTRLAVYGDAAKESALRPGGAINPQPVVLNPYNSSGYDISEGQRLFSWYNCNGCHANGGGGIGPPLIKQQWIYGGEPANIFDTIVKGRPNGMPAWGDRIPEYQIWQLVAYVRSMNGQQPTSATPVRPDYIETNPQTLRNRKSGETK
jgi:cytochrome c oxidase cbb3-type subunit 3